MTPIKLTAIETALYLATYAKTCDRYVSAMAVCELGRIPWQPYSGVYPIGTESIAEYDAVVKARAEISQRIWLGLCIESGREAEALNL